MVWLANQNRALERFLINVCNKKFQNVRCRTFRVWWSLQRFTIPIMLDVSGDFSQTLSGENFEGIMWTLVSVRSISPINIPAIRTLFPDSYGIFEKKANV